MQISFIVTVYNRENTIERCLQSITNSFKNNIQNLEIIIINDYSLDRSKNIIDNFFKKNNIKHLIINNSRNKGSNYSKDIGLKKSTGLWSVLLDSDDELCMEYKELKKYFIKYSDYSIISFKCMYSNLKKIGYQSEKTIKLSFEFYVNNFHKVYEKLDCIKTENFKLKSNNFFDPNIHLGCEFISWSRMYYLNGPNIVINKVARIYNLDSNNQITTKSKKIRSNDFYFAYYSFYKEFKNYLNIKMKLRIKIRIFVYKFLKNFIV